MTSVICGHHVQPYWNEKLVKCQEKETSIEVLRYRTPSFNNCIRTCVSHQFMGFYCYSTKILNSPLTLSEICPPSFRLQSLKAYLNLCAHPYKTRKPFSQRYNFLWLIPQSKILDRNSERVQGRQRENHKFFICALVQCKHWAVTTRKRMPATKRTGCYRCTHQVLLRFEEKFTSPSDKRSSYTNLNNCCVQLALQKQQGYSNMNGTTELLRVRTRWEHSYYLTTGMSGYKER